MNSWQPDSPSGLVRHIATVGISGIVTGLMVGGLGGRLFMRIAGATAPESAQGARTEAGFRVGEVTAAGTIELVVFVGIFVGIVGAVLFGVFRPWLSWAGRYRGAAFGVVLFALGGRLIEEESDQWVREHGPIRPGQAAVTADGALKAGCVIHVVGPHYRASQDNPGLLAQAATAALDAADRNSLRSIAMPAISAGVFGYPRHDATAMIAAAVSAWLREHEESTLKEVRLVGLDPTTAADFGAALEGT